MSGSIEMVVSAMWIWWDWMEMDWMLTKRRILTMSDELYWMDVRRDRESREEFTIEHLRESRDMIIWILFWESTTANCIEKWETEKWSGGSQRKDGDESEYIGVKTQRDRMMGKIERRAE